MTPAARIQASIEILDEILLGSPVEKSLTNWARRSRFAGSKDRAAVRDHVFAALRCKRSFSALGGSETGRGLMIGAVRTSGEALDGLFTGARHAPTVLSSDEVARDFATEAERYDIPEWLWPRFHSSLGDQAFAVAEALQNRAPVHLRVNLIKTDLAGAVAALYAEGIQAVAHPACDTALEVVEGSRKISNSKAYSDGLVELQDAASQAVVGSLDLRPGARVLDYCAGGGGKSLALAAHPGIQVFAHDVNFGRMRDLPKRAERAGAQVTILSTEDLARQAPFDLILADAPCSGSGSWRRAPAGKWALTEARLQELTEIQLAILCGLTSKIASGGVLAYATCSVLGDENGVVVDKFLKNNTEWCESFRKTWLVSHRTDGFFTAHLTR
ncbi:RsmB/NOP family class I SAM-dependent RNA methyltransferase [Ruegeria sp. SCP11]|uniref:RsmB/NOP family class I SAM-dependent RNA methyltransferase n=1 Tax=Ruegeria sp. SCP11 TaxID=3141378 RepID=UPI00333E12CD